MNNEFWKVDFGNILTIISFVGILYNFHKQNEKKINKFEFKISLMWNEFAKRFGIDPTLADKDE